MAVTDTIAHAIANPVTSYASIALIGVNSSTTAHISAIPVATSTANHGLPLVSTDASFAGSTRSNDQAKKFLTATKANAQLLMLYDIAKRTFTNSGKKAMFVA